MDNTTNDKKLQDLYIKEKFQRILIQELLIHSQRLIHNYEKLIEQSQVSSLNEQNQLNNHIIKLFFFDIISRKNHINRIKREFKRFNKNYKLKKSL